MRKCNILVVDDHKQVLKALHQMLENEFGKVVLTSNPDQIPKLIASIYPIVLRILYLLSTEVLTL